MGNACSTGSNDRKGSDAYNPSSNLQNAPPGKSSKSSWKKNSKSKDKGEKFSELSESKQEVSSSKPSDSSEGTTRIIEQEYCRSTHSKLESKVSEDISTSSLPIAQLEISSRPQDKDCSFLGHFNESVKKLITGKIGSQTAFPRSKKIVIYICADHNEFSVEHSVIRDDLYPKLKHNCARKGYELCLLDFHHKLESEYLDDHSFIETCIKEMKPDQYQHHTIPLVFIKEKHGYDMIPCQISDVHFENFLNCVDEAEKSLLTTWYYLEKNLVNPGYKLRHITSCLPNFSSSNPEERSQASTEFQDVIEKLRNIIWKYSTPDMKSIYFKTGLEQEIEAICTYPELKKHCIMFSMFKSSSLTAPSDSQELNLESAAFHKTLHLFNKLKNKLDASRIFDLNGLFVDGVTSSEDSRYKEDSAKQFSAAVLSVVEGIMQEYDEETKKFSELKNAVSCELNLQSDACARKASEFTSLDSALQRLKNYVENSVNEPLIVHGPPGSGKSCLLSKAATLCTDWVPNAIVVFRIVGISVDSSTEERISMSICQQCANLCLPDKQLMRPMTFSERCAALPQLFSQVSATRPLVVIIDGIDHISDLSSSSLAWVPLSLPENIKVILSLSDGCEQLSKVKEIIQNEERYFAMPGMLVQDSLKIFDEALCGSKQRLIDEQHNFVKQTLEDCPNPLFTNMLVHCAKSWSSEVSSDDINAGHDIESQINVEFNTVERKYGKIRVAFALGFLTAGKYGLSNSEVQDLLYINEKKVAEEMKDFEILHEVSPVLLWTQLKRSLKCLISVFNFHGVTITRWSSQEVYDVAKRRYLKENDPNTIHIRKVMVNYFQESCENSRRNSSDGKFLQFILERAFCELPYQAFHNAESISNRYVFDINWLIDKLTNCDTYQVLEDIVLCLSVECQKERNDLELMKEFLERSYEALSWNGPQILPQLYGRLHDFFESEENVVKYPKMKLLYDLAKNPSILPTLLPLNRAVRCIKETDETADAKENVSNHSSLYKIFNHPRLMVSLSPSEGTIVVWDIFTQKALRTMKGISNPRDLQMIDDFNAIVLCNRELKIYNLDEGVLKLNIKGVMNQSMPYFGLHDNEHVVAMSRNRMYVNMMNTQTGDLVTTFKVGEDRFLNSLIVSKNGKVCVCGDQTQKPSPLLVWDLTSRKLMYDLRIPHHEFLTKFAAITDDGNYVVCVSKEVDNSTPSNVVVYDLQSGTLFKKWKPGTNTCSIAISSNGNCVITALEDNTLAVWDLITGALRATLVGHTAPVTDISLSEVGTSFVTYDSKNRDRTIRLWDSTSADVVATFTPDYPIICCQISAQGDSIVLGLDGIKEIVTLILCKDSVTLDKIQAENSNPSSYGNELNHGKTFDLQ